MKDPIGTPKKRKEMPRKMKEMNEKIGPSLTSAWRAELEDLSLLEGKELAARKLVACSCIASTIQKTRQFSLAKFWIREKKAGH